MREVLETDLLTISSRLFDELGFEMRMIVMLALAVILAPPLACAKVTTPQTCDQPAAMSDGWHIAAPEKEGLDPKLMCSIGPSLEKLRGADPDGVVVVRHGALVYEHYFADGTTYGPDTLHGVKSVTKSVVGLLVGIAVDRGWLKSIDDRLSSYVPDDADLQTQGKDTITLRDLLTMTSGLNWPEVAIPYRDPSNIETRKNMALNPYRFILAQPLAETPGTMWNYNSGGVELLGDVLMKVSHESLDKFAQQVLFDPLGITHQAWLSSPGGKLMASGGLWLRPRDMAKIGQLVLNHGNWNGQQIVSAQWISDMVAPHVPLPSEYRSGGPYPGYTGSAYGYLWWLGRLKTPDRSIDWIAGVGWGGQRLYVVPSLDLVIAVTASKYNGNGAQYLAGYTVLDIVSRAAMEH